MPQQCAWTSFYHKTTPNIATTVFNLGDPTIGFHDVPPIELRLCDTCAKIFRTEVEPDPALRSERSLIPEMVAYPVKERLLS